MDGIAVIQMPDKNSLHLQFKYKLSESKSKLFTLKRDQNESLDKLFRRIKNNLKKVTSMDQSKLKIEVLMDGKPVDTINTHKEAWQKGCTLVIGDQIFKVLINAPCVHSIKLPRCLLVGFPVYANIKLMFTTIKQCQYLWYREKLPSEKCDSIRTSMQKGSETKEIDNWILAFEGMVYIPCIEDIGRKLKIRVIPMTSVETGFHLEEITKTTVNNLKIPCPFEKRFNFTQDYTSLLSFRVLCYNILAELYSNTHAAKTKLFPYCPEVALDFDYRKILLLKEIPGYNSDIICLQEVDAGFFSNDLNFVLGLKGYEGVFCKKAFKVSEGVATFYRIDKFSLLEKFEIQLSNHKHKWLEPFHKCLTTNKNLRFSIENKANIALFLLLKSEDKAILVCNTHLFFEPTSDHIRLFQACMIVTYMENLLKLYQSKYKDLTIATIICGDFNSAPENAVYQLMTTGKVDKDILDWKINPKEIVKDLTISHSMSLSSAYGTPAYTNYTQAYYGCLDYIFFDCNKLKLVSNVPFQTDQEVKRHVAIPSIVFPSDHLALVSEFSWF